MIKPISILASLLSLANFLVLLKKFFEQKISKAGFFFWISFWTLVLILAWHPQISDTIAAYLGLGRGVDVVIFGVLLLLIYSIFWLYGKIMRIESEITEIVKEFALLNLSSQEKGVPKDSSASKAEEG